MMSAAPHPSSTATGTSRRDRRGCGYDAYVPDLLAGWNLVMPADLALEGLARVLLRRVGRVLGDRGPRRRPAPAGARRGRVDPGRPHQ